MYAELKEFCIGPQLFAAAAVVRFPGACVHWPAGWLFLIAHYQSQWGLAEGLLLCLRHWFLRSDPCCLSPLWALPAEVPDALMMENETVPI